MRQAINGTDYKLIEDEQKKLQDLLMSLGKKVYSSSEQGGNVNNDKESVIDTDSKDA